MKAIWVSSLALIVAALPALAHHSFAAEYDSKATIELQGVVTKVEWMNPHAHFYMDVRDADGRVANWNLELASPNMLIRNGWKRNSLKEGDEVHVSGARAKDSTNTASASTIKFRDGRTLTFLAAPDAGTSK